MATKKLKHIALFVLGFIVYTIILIYILCPTPFEREARRLWYPGSKKILKVSSSGRLEVYREDLHTSDPIKKVVEYYKKMGFTAIKVSPKKYQFPHMNTGESMKSGIDLIDVNDGTNVILHITYSNHTPSFARKVISALESLWSK